MLVLRVWIEQGGGGLRARITSSDDVEAHQQTSLVVGTVAEVVDVVRAFVEDFVARGGP